MPASRYSEGASPSRTGNRTRSASSPTLTPTPTPSSTSTSRRRATPSLSWSSFTTHTNSNSAYTTSTSSTSPRDRLPGTCSQPASPRFTSRRTTTTTANPGRSLTSRSNPTRHSVIDPAFVLTPLAPPPSPVTPRSPGRVPITTSMSSSFGASGSNAGRDDGGSGGLSDERPRRAVSSPQLVRPVARARSDSASSSDALTATEENYARFRRGSTNGPRSGNAHVYSHGHGYGHHSQARIPPSASASRFPSTYPPLWTFAAQPISPTSPDSSEAATSPSDEASFDEDDDSDEMLREGEEEDELIFVASRASSSTSLSSHSHMRNRRGRKKENERDGSGLAQGLGQGQGQGQMQRVVTTARGQPCAGETETELDEFPIRLPTSRNVDSRPVVPLLIDILVPFLFQVTRFLSVVPATAGIVYNVYLAFHPPQASMSVGARISSIDYVVCALWAALTGFQCLFLTTGLLSRWKAYYTTVSTLIRLVALQCICWPATHFTLMFFDHTRRPVACWALIGTTTCISRSVQLWVTSNLYMPINTSNGLGIRGEGGRRDLSMSSGSKVLRSEGRLGPRRWDWAEVLVKCVLPAGVLYFVTAWAMILKQELEVR